MTAPPRGEEATGSGRVVAGTEQERNTEIATVQGPPDGIAKLAGQAVRWVAVEKWATRLLGLVVFVVLGRLLLPTDFGLVAIATTIVAFLLVLSDQGFAAALVQREHLEERHLSTCFWTGLGVGLVLSGALFAAAPLLAQAYDQPGLTGIVRWLALVIPLECVSAVPSAILERRFEFKALAVRRIAGSVGGSLAALGAAFGGLGAGSLVVQAITTSGISAIVLWSVGKWRPTLTFSGEALRDIWRVGWHIASINLVGYFNAQSDNLVIGIVAGPEVLGYYFIGARIISIITDVQTSIVAQISLATFSRLQSDRPRALSAFYRMTAASSSISLPVYAVSACIAPYVIPILFGSQWAPSVPIMQILCILGALNSIVFFDRNFLISMGESSRALILTVGQAALGVVVIVAAAPFGVIAVALAVVARQYLFWPVRLHILRRYTGLSLKSYFASIWKSVLAGVLSFASGWILVSVMEPTTWPDWAMMLLVGAVAGTVYTVALVLLDRAFLKDILRLVAGRG